MRRFSVSGSPGSLAARVKTLCDWPSLRALLAPCATAFARRQGHGVTRIFCDQDVWIHQTLHGYFAYPQPYIHLDLPHLDSFTRAVFFRGYRPKPGDVILDAGAGTGEETLTFSRAVGATGRVISIEAHPRTFRCLEKLVQYNRLHNVVAVHRAIAEPGCLRTTIEDSVHYLSNRSHHAHGLTVPAVTMDELCRLLRLTRIDFLKMNIEGAERLAIRGMTQMLESVGTLCICCHDFLAEISGDESLRTFGLVKEFLEENGFRILADPAPGDAPYVRDQVWACNSRVAAQMAG